MGKRCRQVLEVWDGMRERGSVEWEGDVRQEMLGRRGDVGKGKGMYSQHPAVILDVLPAWFSLQAGLTWRDSHGNNFASTFSARIYAGPQQKSSVVFQPVHLCGEQHLVQ